MLKKEQKVYIWLSLFQFMGKRKKQQLLSLYDTPEQLWDKFAKNDPAISMLLKPEQISQMQFSHDDNFLQTYVQNCEAQGIELVVQGEKEYPTLLMETQEPPLVLYCKGDKNLLNSKCISVVGTRKPTQYGKEITVKFSGAFARAGLTVVSGLAYGVDTEAARACVDNKGKSIVVLGCGINEIYPASNLGLAREIVKLGGLIVSEYKPNEKPQRYYFPERNRIIAGLSKGLLITEASEKSGTMHTKNYALDYNRNLYVVPGRLTDSMSMGCNKIIKNLQSSMVLSPLEILEEYGVQDVRTPKMSHIQLDLNDEIVLSFVPSEGTVDYETLLQTSNLESKTLNTVLVRLEMKGLIKKESGNQYHKHLT